MVTTLGYIDESYEGIAYPENFTLSCSLALGGEWAFIEAAWVWILEEKNQSLIAAGRKPLSRYHAVDCFNRCEEFEGWEKPERDQFVSKLFGIFDAFQTAHITLTISARDIAEVWPENQEQPLHFAYNTLIKLLMLEIARHRFTLGLSGKVSLVYERSQYGESMLKGFNRMMDDPTFAHKNLFTTLAPMGWEDCIPLQPADLVAYEAFRDMKRRKVGKPMNRSLAALVEKENFNLISKRIARENLVDLRRRHEAALARKSVTD